MKKGLVPHTSITQLAQPLWCWLRLAETVSGRGQSACHSKHQHPACTGGCLSPATVTRPQACSTNVSADPNPASSTTSVKYLAHSCPNSKVVFQRKTKTGEKGRQDIIGKKLVLPLVQFSCSVLSGSLRPHEPQHPRPPCLSPTPRAYLNSHPSSWWCHPVISSCHPLLLLPPIPPSIRVFSNESTLLIRWPKYWSFSLASVLPMNTQDWFHLGWTGWISLQSKGLSRVFANTTVQKHQFFGAQLSSQSNSHIHTWPLEKP